MPVGAPLPGMEQPVAVTPPRRGVSIHGVQPFTVLRADQAGWQERKRWWHSQGLDDAAGRPDAAVYPTGPHAAVSGGQSVFDPVLAEVCLGWYSRPGAHVLDPMAGGPTRGAVAAALGRHYVGIDLLAGQVDYNRATYQQWGLRVTGTARWVSGDARKVVPLLPGGFDYALSCPPYWRLERYSDDPGDLSTMPLDEFLVEHARIIGQTAWQLRDDAFATWVVGDLRGDDGALCRLPDRTVDAFEHAGMRLVNDQILITPVGTRHLTMRHPWRVARSATRLHQYVLTFVKGDRRQAAAAASWGWPGC